MEAIPEGETELEAIQVFGLLDKCPEGVNIFIEHALSLTVLVLIPQRESHSLGRIKGKEFHLEISLKGCPIYEAVYPAQTLEHLECVGQCTANLHVQEHPDDFKSVGGKGIASKLDIGDAGLKETFTGGTTSIVSIQEHGVRDFCKCGDRGIAARH